MPVLVRYSRMTGAQRALVLPARDRAAARWFDLSSSDVDWRLCVYFRKSLDRPVRNRGYLFLTEQTPQEILWTCEPGDLTGVRLVAEAQHALDTDLLAAKAPLLVLCDWLDEHDMPEAEMLRAFCWLPHRWNRFCLQTK